MTGNKTRDNTTRADDTAEALPPSVSPSEQNGKQLQDATIEIYIPSHTEFVRVVRLAVSGVASLMPFTYDEVEDVKLAVSEACNNAILHAHEGNGGEVVVIRLTMQADRLAISVQDQGKGIPAEKRRLADHPPEELAERGLGLFLIQAVMDEVKYETAAQSGTTVRMTKYLAEKRPSQEEDSTDYESPVGV